MAHFPKASPGTALGRKGCVAASQSLPLCFPPPYPPLLRLMLPILRFKHIAVLPAASPSILPRCVLDSGWKPGVGRPAFLFLLAGPGVRCFLESSFGSSAYFHVAVSPHVWNCLGSSPPSNASRDLFLSSWGPSSQFWLFHKLKLCFSCPGLMS